MEPGQMAETTLRIPFWFTHAMLTFYAQQAFAVVECGDQWASQ